MDRRQGHSGLPRIARHGLGRSRRRARRRHARPRRRNLPRSSSCHGNYRRPRRHVELRNCGNQPDPGRKKPHRGIGGRTYRLRIWKENSVKKLRVGVLFGGRSGEHEISLLSAASVLNAIDKTKYDVVPIGITKEGLWVTAGHAEALLQGKQEPRALRACDPDTTSSAAVLAQGSAIVIPPVPAKTSRASIAPFQTGATEMSRRWTDHSIQVDVIFPVLHGTFGEDGTIQGLLELADIAYVGAGVLGSACGMDKHIMKELFRAADLPLVKHATILRSDWEASPAKARRLIESKLKYPVFVKPANLGSSE